MHDRGGRHACIAAVLALLTLFAPQAMAQATVLEVIPLKYRTAEQVIPLIQPMLAHEGSVSGLQNQLIVRTTPGNLAEIRRILASVDTMPRRLLITVRQDADNDRSRRAAEISGSVGNDHARVTIPGSGDRRGGSVVLNEGDDRLRARMLDSRSTASDRNTQTLQVLEGNAAFIRIGQSVPVPRRQVTQTVINGQVVSQVVDSVEYRDVSSGFQVVPRVAGERVTLDINPQNDTLNRRIPGAVNVQRVATTVSGRLGDWIEIAGLDQERNREQSALLGRTSSGGSDNRRVLIKVEELK
jgi:type II secretory pathway component GspD/PulD (secretin)